MARPFLTSPEQRKTISNISGLGCRKLLKGALVLNSVKISVKLPIVIIALCLLVGASISVSAYLQSRQTLQALAKDTIDVLMIERAAQIERWAANIESLVESYSADPTVRDAALSFTNTFRLMGDDPTGTLQEVYITNNPHPFGDRDLLLKPDAPHRYHLQHERLHPFFADIAERDGYYDIFLFNLTGDLIYSTEKESDFATNIVTGPYADSGLATLVRQLMDQDDNTLSSVDYSAYEPSHGAPAAFLATKIVSEWGDTIGVFAVQLPDDIPTEILSNPAGLQNTGDIIAVGQNGNARSGSRFDDGPEVLGNFVDTQRLAAFANTDDSTLVNVAGYRGENVISILRPIRVFDFDWLLVAEIDTAEVIAPAIQLRNIMTIIGLATVCVSGGIGLLFASSVTTPLSRLRSAMENVAGRHTDTKIEDTHRADEIGDIANTLVSFRDQLDASDEAARNTQRQQSERDKVVAKLNEALTGLAQGDLTKTIDVPFAAEFEPLRNNYNNSIRHLSGVVTTLITNSAAIQSDADDMFKASNDLQLRTENQAATLEETAAALDELTSSVKAAAIDAESVKNIVSEAETDATSSGPIVAQAAQAMAQIETSSGSISEIIEVINGIAFQTNLLALNAGVEAARAGDAGRGFAVVASEVRALAQRSTEASQKTQQLIDSSTAEVARGVSLVNKAGEALTRIVARMTHINEVTAKIAGSVAEQSGSLTEINVGVASLDRVTQQNAAMVDTVTRGGQSLNVSASKLSEISEYFQVSRNQPEQEAMQNNAA